MMQNFQKILKLRDTGATDIDTYTYQKTYLHIYRQHVTKTSKDTTKPLIRQKYIRQKLSCQIKTFRDFFSLCHNK